MTVLHEFGSFIDENDIFQLTLSFMAGKLRFVVFVIPFFSITVSLSLPKRIKSSVVHDDVGNEMSGWCVNYSVETNQLVMRMSSK